MTNTPELTIERLFASPKLTGPAPQNVKFSPDGQRVTFLKNRKDNAQHFDLWQFDVASGAQSLLIKSDWLDPNDVELDEAEKALRERQRIATRKGIVSYHWGSADQILVPFNGTLYLVTLSDRDEIDARALTQSQGFEYDAKISPNGQYASFIRDGSLYIVDLISGQETRISPAAAPDAGVSYGVAEFVAQEEMSRYTGYWWSASDRYLAYTEVNESGVDIIERLDVAKDESQLVAQRYPRAGRPNAIVDLHIYELETGQHTKLASFGPDTYLARVNWNQDEIWFQAVNREQTCISYNRALAPDWRSEPVHSENQTSWVNLSSDFVTVDPHNILITEEKLQSDDTGAFRHIRWLPHPDLPTTDEKHRRPELTSGDWPVSAILAVNEETRQVFFSGHKDTPLEQHLYSVSLTGGPPVRITQAGKSWSVMMAPNGASFVGRSSGPDHPAQTGLYTASGELITWIEENRLDSSHPYAPYLARHTVPEFGQLKAEDGQDLYYSIHKPAGFRPTQQYPVILEVYGGPHAQTVTREWERMGDNFYTRQGYIVFRLDNRGSAHRGKRFEDTIYRKTGAAEVRDQLTGVEWLKQQDYVDPSRIAIQGWSYGGYMTLMTILQAPIGTFAAAISGAPVTDWSLYDTFYTERYMGTPEANPEGYKHSSVFSHLDRLTTPLLLIHGMADDNVTFDNSTRLMAALQERGKHFELMTYPGQRHGITGPPLERHLMTTRMQFLNRHLQGGPA